MTAAPESSYSLLSDFSKANLTFEGRRGLLRKKWSLTLNADPLKDNEPNAAPEPMPAAVTAPAAKDPRQL